MQGKDVRREEVRKYGFREMRRPFLWSVTWSNVGFGRRWQLISCQSVLTAAVTFDGVCVFTHLHCDATLHSIFILCTAQRHRNHFYWQNVFVLFINYLHLCLLIFWLWIHCLITQNMIRVSFKQWKLFIRLNVSGKS